MRSSGDSLPRGSTRSRHPVGRGKRAEVPLGAGRLRGHRGFPHRGGNGRSSPRLCESSSPRVTRWARSQLSWPTTSSTTYNLYTYWAERKAALTLWHEKLAGLKEIIKCSPGTRSIEISRRLGLSFGEEALTLPAYLGGEPSLRPDEQRSEIVDSTAGLLRRLFEPCETVGRFRQGALQGPPLLVDVPRQAETAQRRLRRSRPLGSGESGRAVCRGEERGVTGGA